VVFPGFTGPGASDVPEDRVLLFRGLTAEVWSLAAGRRIAELPGPGEGWFGGTLREVAPWVPERGVLVTSVVAGEPADRLRIRPGDWIVSWDGRTIESAARFMQLAAAARPGDRIEVRILRGGVPLLESFTPGRRPPRDGLTEPGRLHVAADGRVLVPGRRDLAWVDLGAATRTPLWSYDGSGVVASAALHLGLVVVHVRRLREGDVLVAVDPARGVERWRTVLEDSVDRIEATGSAIVAFAEAPPATHVIDAATGSRRLSLETPDLANASPRNFLPVTRSAVAAGRAWWIAGLPGHPYERYELRSTNTTTGETEGAWPLDDVAPQVGAGAVVAVVSDGDQLRLVLPDPHGGARAGPVEVQGAARDTLRAVIDPDVLSFATRVRVAGTTVHLVLESHVASFAVDPSALLPSPTSGEEGGEDADLLRPVLPVREEIHDQVSPRLYLFELDVGLDGLFLTSGRLDVGPSLVSTRQVLWVAGRPGGADPALRWRFPQEGERGGVLEVRRPGPARQGPRLLFATDGGAAILPLR
jgi:hypothetical protein